MTRKHAPTYQAHMARYCWALPYCYKKDVLEVGCGEGFGAHLLSQVANHIYLTDKDTVFLKHAQQWFKYFCPVDAVACDLDKNFPASTDGYDVVVAFEVIEHLEHPELFLAAVKDQLKAGGKLLFSVPYMMKAKDHKQLFNKTSIYNLISKFLEVEKIFIQDKNLDDSPMMQWEGKEPLSCIIGVATK